MGIQFDDEESQPQSGSGNVVFDDETGPKWSDLPGNILPNAEKVARGAFDTGVRIDKGLFDLPSDAKETVKGEYKNLFAGENPFKDVLDSPMGEDMKTVGGGLLDTVKAIPGQIMDLGSKDAWVNRPVENALTAATIAGIGKDIVGKGAPMAEMPKVAETPKELPVMEPGAKTGDPHALFSFNDNFGPEGKPRSMYTIYGDPAHPVFGKKSAAGMGGYGSTMTKGDLADLDIPVVGREARSVGKWDPLDLGESPKGPSDAPSAKNMIGQRLASRITSQALDINPLAARKLAAKAGVSPEEAILDLGTKANDLIPNLIEPMDSANSKFSKVLNAHDTAGKEIGRIIDDATKGTKGAFPEANETIGALRSAAEHYYQIDGGDLALQKTAERLESLQKAGNLDFDRLSQVKSDIGKGFNKTEAPPGTEEIYGILNDGIDKVINRLSVENPSLGGDFSRLKQVYTVTSRLLPAMSRTAAREVSGSSMGSGLLGKMVPSAIGGAIGGVPGALLAGGAKYLQEAVAPDLGSNLSYMAMQAAPEIVAKIQKAFPGISKNVAAKIAARLSLQNQKPDGMSQGGVVPKDVRDYVKSRPC